MPYCLTDIKIEVSFLLKIITICSRKVVPFRTKFHFYHCKQKAFFDVVGVLVSSCVVPADVVGTDTSPTLGGGLFLSPTLVINYSGVSCLLEWAGANFLRAPS